MGLFGGGKKKKALKAKNAAKRKASRDRVIQMAYGAWDSAVSNVDTTADFGKVDTMMDFLEGSIAKREGEKGFDQAKVDKMKEAIAASRQRELILRQKSAAPEASQYAFNTVLNKSNIFNK